MKSIKNRIQNIDYSKMKKIWRAPWRVAPRLKAAVKNLSIKKKKS